MGVGFNAAKVADGLTGVASNLAYGTAFAARTATEGVRLGSALLNLFNTDNYTGRTVGGVAAATGGSPTEWLNQYISKAYSQNGIIRYMYSKLFRDLMPDISGYTLLFMSPPVLSGYLSLGNQNYDPYSTSFVSETAKLYPLLATNFTPPTIQLNTGALAGSSGTQHYASELSITDSMSVSYIDTINLDVYAFHSSWIKYIFQVLEGTLEPAPEYLTNRTIDYAASFYFVKFQPNMSQIQYVGKAIKPSRL